MATISQPADDIESLDASSTPTRREELEAKTLASDQRRIRNLVVSLFRRFMRILPALSLSFFGFLAFYLLSAGPVAGIHNVLKVGAFQKAVEVIYAPIVLLVKSNIEPFSSIMKWYIDLFR